ncbi:MAG: IS1380 family transposase [Phycisphaerae bacterium]
MTRSTYQILRNGKQRIERRLNPKKTWAPQDRPMFSGTNPQFELAERTKAISCGGIGLMLRLAEATGLREAIDRRVRVLKVHLPYHESDHVLNIAFNFLAGGRCLQDLELLRNDENYLNAIGAQRIPDPTTAGDFCRRFDESTIEELQGAINDARVGVWREQPEEFLREAIIDADGTMAATSGECKDGMDVSWKGVWGYHPLLVSLANTQEPLFLMNRSGNRPSHEGAAEYLDKSIALCRRAGFREVTLRGDTDFSMTQRLDGWHRDDVRFVFGYDANRNLVRMAENLPEEAWEKLERPEKYTVKTEPRSRADNVKRRIVKEREFKNFTLRSEQVAEFPYRPVACETTYRMVVLRKNITVERGDLELFDEIRYFFYITNDWIMPAAYIVYDANHRCQQENLIEQLKNGVRALHTPVNSLLSNWAYMVIASLAWSLKAWLALWLPEGGRWAKKHAAQKTEVLRMEFRTFLNQFMLIPAQIVRQGRRTIYRFLCWRPKLPVFFRAWKQLRTQRC